MVLEQVVPGWMVPVGPAALLVHKRVRDGVRPDVHDVTERKSQELLEPLPAALSTVAQCLGLVYQGLAHRRSAAVVGHVAPEEILLWIALGDDGVHVAPDVDKRRELLLADQFDREQ